jgi:AraC-like DNA-binding protein
MLFQMKKAMARNVYKESDTEVLASDEITVWDTEYFAANRASEHFSRGIQASMLPLATEIKTSQHFSGRIESRAHKSGTLVRIQVSPHVCYCPAPKVCASSGGHVVVCYVIGGEISIDQAGRLKKARTGDIIFFRNDAPLTITHAPKAHYKALAVTLERTAVENIFSSFDQDYTNVVIPRERLALPLSVCAAFLVRNFRVLEREGIDSTIEALLALLPIGMGEPSDQESDTAKLAQIRLRTRLINFIEENIRNPNLTPKMAADHFGVSTRYIHKIFAASGNTFATSVTSARLDCIRRELESFGERRRCISSLACYWGFDSISTFNRAFKRRFDSSPRAYVAR